MSSDIDSQEVVFSEGIMKEIKESQIHEKMQMQHFRFIGLSKEGMSEKDGNFVEKRRRKLGNNILI